MADSWRRGRTTSMTRTWSLAQPRCQPQARLEHAYQNGPDDFLSFVVRAREMGCSTGCGCPAVTTGSGRVGVDSVRAGSRPSSPQPRLCDDGPEMMAVGTLNSTACEYRVDPSSRFRVVGESTSLGAVHPLPRHGPSLSAAHNRLASRCRHACRRTWPSGWGRESGRVAANSTACSSPQIMSVSPGPRPGPGSGV